MKMCPKCKEATLDFLHGCGFDYDRWMCVNKTCEYESVLAISTYPKKDRSLDYDSTKKAHEIKTILHEIETL